MKKKPIHTLTHNRISLELLYQPSLNHPHSSPLPLRVMDTEETGR